VLVDDDVMSDWTQVFRSEASVYALDESIKQWNDRGTSGVVTMLKAQRGDGSAPHIRLKWELGSQPRLWQLSASKIEPKGERAIVLKALAISPLSKHQEILAVRFPLQTVAVEFAKHYYSVFPATATSDMNAHRLFEPGSAAHNSVALPSPVIKPKSKSSPSQIDVLCLICDILVASKRPKTMKQCLREIVDLTYKSTRETHKSLRSAITSGDSTHRDLIKFVKESINRSLRAQGLVIEDKGINWLSVFYNRAATSTLKRLSVISPILTLHNTHKADPLRIVRKCVPASHCTAPNTENLFGSLGCVNTEHLSDDLLHRIVSFLDLRQFFLCSLLNHSWLNVVYRSDVFRGILDRFFAADSLRCVLVDVPPKEGNNQPLPSISGQIRPCSSEWDFFTSQPCWLGRCVDLESAAIKLQKRVDSGWKSTNAGTYWSERKHDYSYWTKMDTRAVDVKKVLSDDRAGDLYRLHIKFKAPFELTLISEPRTLGHLRYSQALLPAQLLWRRHFDQLFSNDSMSRAEHNEEWISNNNIKKALSSILEALPEGSLCSDVESCLLNPQSAAQIIRLMEHQNKEIRIKADELISELFKKDFPRRERFLRLCTAAIHGRDAISIAVGRLLVGLNRRKKKPYKEIRFLFCLVGEFMRSAGDLKHIAQQHSITIAPVMIRALRDELATIGKSDSTDAWLCRSKALWCLSTLSEAHNDGETSRSIMRVLLDWARRISTTSWVDEKIKNDVLGHCQTGRNVLLCDSKRFDIFDGSISCELIEHELDYDKYLSPRSLEIIYASLRSHLHLAKTYIRLQLPSKLHRILRAVKKKLPKEDISQPVNMASPRFRYQYCVYIINEVAAYREFFNLTTLMLDILCIYGNKAMADTQQNREHIFAAVIGYLWRSLTHNPHHFEKALTQHKKFMQLLQGLYEEMTSSDSPHGLLLARAVSNLRNVLSDRRLFRGAFLSQNSFDDGGQECVCVCGSTLNEVKARDIRSAVSCSMCCVSLSGEAVFYRCNTTRPEHKPERKYVLCFSCAKRQAFIHASEVEQ